MKKHLQEQIDLYGRQTMVNLVNHKGYEKPIKEAFEKYVTEVSQFQFNKIFATQDNSCTDPTT